MSGYFGQGSPDTPDQRVLRTDNSNSETPGIRPDTPDSYSRTSGQTSEPPDLSWLLLSLLVTSGPPDLAQVMPIGLPRCFAERFIFCSTV
jgi:hypothetical protein